MTILNHKNKKIVNAMLSCRGFYRQCFMVFVMAIMMSTSWVCLADQKVNTDELKAVYLFNFSAFVEWPQSSFSHTNQSFKYCIFGNSNIVYYLNDIVKNEVVNNREIQVIDGFTYNKIKSCQILFVDASAEDKVINTLKLLKENSTLLVGESLDFLDRGGMINLNHDYKRIEIEINLANARKGNLRISSKLLRLAKLK